MPDPYMDKAIEHMRLISDSRGMYELGRRSSINIATLDDSMCSAVNTSERLREGT